MAFAKILIARAKMDGRLRTVPLELVTMYLASTGNVTMGAVTVICCGQAINAIRHFAPTGVPIGEPANSAVASASRILPELIVAYRFAQRDAQDMAVALHQ